MKDKIREATIDAAKQRDRKVKLIDKPPDLLKHNTKKRKEPPTMFRNAVRPSDQAKLATSMSSSTTSASTLSKQMGKDEALRRRLVHCIAVSERTRDQILKMVGGSDCDMSLRREILILLEMVRRSMVTSMQLFTKVSLIGGRTNVSY
jgi:RNA polymerase II elongation factor ELL